MHARIVDEKLLVSSKIGSSSIRNGAQLRVSIMMYDSIISGRERMQLRARFVACLKTRSKDSKLTQKSTKTNRIV